MAVPRHGTQQSGLQARLTTFGGRTSLLVIAAGLVVIALGYNGISGASINNVPNIQAQLPYIISGGVFGLALVIVGAALMITQGAREDRAKLVAKLDQLIDAQQDQGTPTTAVPSDAEGLFAAGSASYHRAGCRLVDGREQTTYVTAEEAGAQDLKPCRVCQPDKSSTNVTIR